MADISRQTRMGGGVSTRILAPLIVLGIIVALSGVEYAQAQTPLNAGKPLYGLPVDKVTTQCAATSTGTVEFTDAGLLTTHLQSDAYTYRHIAYIEVHANSTDKSIGIFNFTASSLTVSVTIPTSALMNITDVVDTEKFTVRPIFSTIVGDRDDPIRFIDNPNISLDIYKTLSYVVSGSTLIPALITPNGMDLAVTVSSGTINTGSTVRHPSAPNPVLCSTGSAEIQKLPRIEIDGVEYVDGVQTDASLHSNRHTAGATYTEQEADCFYLDEKASAFGTQPPNFPRVEINAHGINDRTPSNTITPVIYTCHIDENTSNTKTNTVLVVARKNPIITTDRTSTHTAGAPFADTTSCLGSINQVLTLDTVTKRKVTETSSVIVSNIDHTTIPGDYIIEYTCSETYLTIDLMDASESREVSVTGRIPAVTPTPTGTPMLDTGAPLYMNPTPELSGTCSQKTTGTAEFILNDDEEVVSLNITHTLSAASNVRFDSIRTVAYIDIRVDGADAGIGVFNYAVDGRVFSANVPVSALLTLTDDIYSSTFVTVPYVETTSSDADPGRGVKYVSHPDITTAIFYTFSSFIIDTWAVLFDRTVVHNDNGVKDIEAGASNSVDTETIPCVIHSASAAVSAEIPKRAIVPGVTRIDRGESLFLKLTEQVPEQCSQTSTGTAKFTSAGLSTEHTIQSAAAQNLISYIEVTASSTEKSFAVYNYFVPESTKVSVNIPTAALEQISDTPNDETYTIRPVQSLIKIDDGTSNKYRFINNTEITLADYKTFTSFIPGTNALLVPGGNDLYVEFDNTGVVETINTRFTPVDTKMCYTGSTQISALSSGAGPPLYIKKATAFDGGCASRGIDDGRVGFPILEHMGTNLLAEIELTNPLTYNNMSYFEISSSQPDGGAIAVYNFSQTGGKVSASVPFDALKLTEKDGTISATDTFVVRFVYSTITLADGQTVKFVDNPNIPRDEYATTFQSFNNNPTLLVPGGTDTLVTIDSSGEPEYLTDNPRADTPNIVLCGIDSTDVVIFDVVPPEFDPGALATLNFLPGQYDDEQPPPACTDVHSEGDPNRPTTTVELVGVFDKDFMFLDKIDPTKPGTYSELWRCTDGNGFQTQRDREVIIGVSSSGDDDDWRLNPTFGRSWDSNEQLVTDGFAFDTKSVDITNNFHTKFKKITAEVGKLHTVKAKVYTEMTLDTIILSLGVPEPSRVSDSEAEILIKLQLDYQNEAEYDIVDIIHEQDENLVDTTGTLLSVAKVSCTSDSDLKCHEFGITFRIMAPLKSDVLAISAMDIDRRITTTYINDGVEFTGESLLPAETITLQFKRGNQHPVDTIILTQEDRRYNVWTDQHGYIWLKNSYDSWFQVTYADFERLQDPHAKVMTRTHSDFTDLIEYEKERARQVFDSESIKSTVGESFSHDAPVKIDKLNNPIILEKLKIAELAALEYLKNYR